MGMGARQLPGAWHLEPGRRSQCGELMVVVVALADAAARRSRSQRASATASAEGRGNRRTPGAGSLLMDAVDLPPSGTRTHPRPGHDVGESFHTAEARNRIHIAAVVRMTRGSRPCGLSRVFPTEEKEEAHPKVIERGEGGGFRKLRPRREAHP